MLVNISIFGGCKKSKTMFIFSCRLLVNTRMSQVENFCDIRRRL